MFGVGSPTDGSTLKGDGFTPSLAPSDVLMQFFVADARLSLRACRSRHNQATTTAQLDQKK